MINNTAVLLTCFNRKANTLACLKQLFNIKKDVSVYLVDDGSTDGTTDAILVQFPQVQIISGNGNLFWNRGMHLAWQVASKKSYEYYLWLNDDVVLYENCFEELFYCSQKNDNNAIISGIIESVEKETIYGGTDTRKLLIEANGLLNPIANMNGNVVLVPKGVFLKTGNLDPYFHHDLGDVDYGWRAIRNGIGVFTTRTAVACGEKNDFCRVRLNKSSFLKRFKRLYSPLGSNPRINFYSKRHQYGIINALVYYLFLHFINVIPDELNAILFGNKYQ